jgi:S1-C subfamily serine protease
VNLLDLLIIGAVALAAYSGYRRGALMQVASFGGLFLGLVAGALLAPELAQLATDPSTQAVITLVAFIGLTVLGNGLGWALGVRVWAMTRRSPLRGVDAAVGSVVAIGAVLLATWFIALNLVTGPFPTVANQIRGSAVVRGLDAVLPPPPSLLAEVRQFLNKFGFPDVFAGLPPAPAGPVDPPSGREAQAAFDAAAPSTVRVMGQACGRIQEGSGFVVAPGYVVTNAHVVAGVQRPEVQEQGGGEQVAATVLFDDDIDMAVLRVGDTPGPPLSLAEDELDRGAAGAVVGFPAGGGLAGEPAASRRVLRAVGRDIYGDGSVVRSIYELQAVVRPGNSGGPFVLVDGRVAGLVFAASTTDPAIGYAITSLEIADEVAEAVGDTSAVSTGPCIR